MRIRNRGEERRFFPFFILWILIGWIGGFAHWAGPNPAGGAQSAELSAFDRLAEEATQLNRKGLYDQVIALLEPRKGDPRNDSALFFNELGIAYRNRGKYAEAIEAYRMGLQRDPENPVLMKNLGDAYILQQAYSQAIEQLQKALKGNPRFHQAHFSLGVAYYRMGKYPEALEAFERVLQLSPGDGQAQRFRAEIQKKLKSSPR